MTVTAAEAPADTGAMPGLAIPFTVASRPQKRLANIQSGISNAAGAGSFQIVQLNASGWVRKISLLFTATWVGTGGGVVAGDAPFNLIRAVTLTDATGQPVVQPISGYSLYLVNKYFKSGAVATNLNRPFGNPQLSPEFAFSNSGTAGTAVFRLDLDFEVDPGTGYGCIPNLDSNASLQLKVDYDVASVIFSGTTTTSVVSMRVSQSYWAPVGSTLGGQPVSTEPLGAGDYVETRYETQTASASAENQLTLTNRGGLIKGLLLVSRAAGVRTAITPTSNLGILLDNQPINEGIPIEEHYDELRRGLGYWGADITTSYAPLGTQGVMTGLDRGVVPINFDMMSAGRDSWLNTRAGSLLQVKITPGASATTVEIITQLAQVKNPAAFFNNGGA